jgi:hypothetical protein
MMPARVSGSAAKTCTGIVELDVIATATMRRALPVYVPPLASRSLGW